MLAPGGQGERRGLKRKATRKAIQRRLANKERAFLAAVALTGSITEAAAAAKIDRSWHYERLKTHPAYPARFAEAMARGDDALEDEVTYRAKRGVYEPLVWQGRFQYPQERYEISPEVPAGDWKDEKRVEAVPAEYGWRDVPGAPPLGVWRKSDALLMFRQRGRFARYRQNFTEVTGPGGGPIELSVVERLNAARNRLAAVAKKNTDS